MAKRVKPTTAVKPEKNKRSNQKTAPAYAQVEQETSNEQMFQTLRQKLKIQFKNPRQESLWNMIDKNQITISSGPAGTGKTFIALAKALSLLVQENSPYHKLIIIKPVVEADEKLGFLPGNVEEKLEPYTFSIFYLIDKLITKKKREKLVERGVISVMALAYLRGMNIDKSLVLIDEFQNTSAKQMKTALTRIGEKSKFIVGGDADQSDRFTLSKDTGLHIAKTKLKNVPGIGIHEFLVEDIVRNPLVGVIIEKLNGDC